MASRPDILLIISDQQRWDALAAAGNAEIRTPHLDRLAARGVRFERCFSQSPVCMPSRASLWTGQYPSTLGITSMGVTLPEDTPVLPVLMGRAGYWCSLAGKLHFRPHAGRDHREPHAPYGFDELAISEEPGPYDDAYRAHVRRVLPEALDDISGFVDPPAAAVWRDAVQHADGIRHPGEWDPWTPAVFSGPNGATHTAFVADRTIETLGNATAGGGPRFITAGFYNPHSPLVAPKRFYDLYDADALTSTALPDSARQRAEEAGLTPERLRAIKHGYYAMVSELDHHVGRVLEAAERSGREMVVVFTSDHGEFLGEQASLGKGFFGPDCVTRVPFIVAGAGVDPGVYEEMIELVDLAPTLLELAGVPVPGRMQGRSLVPTLRGAAIAPKGCVLTEDSTRKPAWKSVRTRTHRFVLDASGSELLHAVEAGFGEYEDLVASEPELLSAMRRLLAHRLIEIERPRAAEWTY